MPGYLAGRLPSLPHTIMLVPAPLRRAARPPCSTAWNPGILAGIAVPQKPDELFHDMHAYLAAAGGWAVGRCAVFSV